MDDDDDDDEDDEDDNDKVDAYEYKDESERRFGDNHDARQIKELAFALCGRRSEE